MADDWEDWEIEDYNPVLNKPNEQQLKILEERKLVEESDAKLAKKLFSNEDEEDLIYEELNNINIHQKNNAIKIIKKKPTKIVSNQKANEIKQKELSDKIKESKIKKQKEIELYGEAEYDEYEEYGDKFYQ